MTRNRRHSQAGWRHARRPAAVTPSFATHNRGAHTPSPGYRRNNVAATKRIIFPPPQPLNMSFRPACVVENGKFTTNAVKPSTPPPPPAAASAPSSSCESLPLLFPAGSRTAEGLLPPGSSAPAVRALLLLVFGASLPSTPGWVNGGPGALRLLAAARLLPRSPACSCCCCCFLALGCCWRCVGC